MVISYLVGQRMLPEGYFLKHFPRLHLISIHIPGFNIDTEQGISRLWLYSCRISDFQVVSHLF